MTHPKYAIVSICVDRGHCDDCEYYGYVLRLHKYMVFGEWDDDSPPDETLHLCPDCYQEFKKEEVVL